MTSSQTGEIAAASTLQHVSADSEKRIDGLQCNGVSLAKKALSTSKQASSVAEDLKSIKADDDSIPFGLVLSPCPTLTSLIYFSCLFVWSVMPKLKTSIQSGIY